MKTEARQRDKSYEEQEKFLLFYSYMLRKERVIRHSQTIPPGGLLLPLTLTVRGRGMYELGNGKGGVGQTGPAQL